MTYENSSYIQPWCYNRSISPDGSTEKEDKIFLEKSLNDKVKEIEEEYIVEKKKYMKEWREKNKEKIREYNVEYRKRKREILEKNKNLEDGLKFEIEKINEEIKNIRSEIEYKTKKIKKLENRKICCLKLLK